MAKKNQPGCPCCEEPLSCDGVDFESEFPEVQITILDLQEHECIKDQNCLGVSFTEMEFHATFLSLNGAFLLPYDSFIPTRNAHRYILDIDPPIKIAEYNQLEVCTSDPNPVNEIFLSQLLADVLCLSDGTVSVEIAAGYQQSGFDGFPGGGQRPIQNAFVQSPGMFSDPFSLSGSDSTNVDYEITGCLAPSGDTAYVWEWNVSLVPS